MDYDDIKSRLTRTLSSLNERFDENIEKYVQVEEWQNGQGVSILFGGADEQTIMNRILIILYNLASLKDHLKNKLKAKNLDAKLIESEIENSLHLQVLVDVVNQEKHGTPLKNSRSKRAPIIRHPEIGYFPFRKRPGSMEEGVMVIHALIKDDKENILFHLDELVDVCFLKWETIVKTYHLDT